MNGGRQIAARVEDFKYIHIRNQPAELYNLGNDLSETKNLAGVKTNELNQVEGKVNKWNSQLIPPAFPGLAGHSKPPAEP